MRIASQGSAGLAVSWIEQTVTGFGATFKWPTPQPGTSGCSSGPKLPDVTILEVIEEETPLPRLRGLSFAALLTGSASTFPMAPSRIAAVMVAVKFSASASAPRREPRLLREH